MRYRLVEYVRAYPDDAYDYAKLTAAARDGGDKDPATVTAEWFEEASGRQ
jgi:hypothetical protein